MGLTGFPAFLRRLPEQLAPELLTLPGVYSHAEEGWTELSPFAYQTRTLLQMVARLLDTGHLNPISETPELQAQTTQWGDLARQHVPCQRQHIQHHRRLSYGYAVGQPEKALLIRGPYDRAWLAHATRIPGQYWSGRDQAHMIPSRSYGAAL